MNDPWANAAVKPIVNQFTLCGSCLHLGWAMNRLAGPGSPTLHSTISENAAGWHWYLYWRRKFGMGDTVAIPFFRTPNVRT